MFSLTSGFHIVIGNPPYVSFGARNQQRISCGQDQFFRRCFPEAAEYKIRLHSIFQQLSIMIAKPGGEVVLLLPDAFLLESTPRC